VFDSDVDAHRDAPGVDDGRSVGPTRTGRRGVPEPEGEFIET
jgi:hypothetical protein